jgi:hypothetical protein
MGDQAYAPFGAGRETGHQVPVVAAKRKRDRYRELDEHPMQRKGRGREARVINGGRGFSPRFWSLRLSVLRHSHYFTKRLQFDNGSL